MKKYLLKRLPFVIEFLVSTPFVLLSFFLPSHEALWAMAIFMPFILLLSAISEYLNSESLFDYVRHNLFSLFLLIPSFIVMGRPTFLRYFVAGHLFYGLFYSLNIQNFFHSFIKFFIEKIQGPSLRPSQLILLSFVGMILLGALLLMLPISLQEQKTLSFVQALFMATSATCVTGLSLFSLTEQFSFFGQLVLLMLIQIGGIGVMALSSSLSILLGKSLTIKDRLIYQDSMDINSLEDLFEMVISIIRYTFQIEFVGAILLSLGFFYKGLSFEDAVYQGVFHSISAFCNAGLSLFDNSLESFAFNPLIHGVIALLIILGGIGFFVQREVIEVIKGRCFLQQLSANTKIVLSTTLMLLVLGTLFLFFGEFLHGLDKMSLWEKMQISFFQSVTLRTAGFNTIPLSQFHAFTLYGMLFFMFVGASPGGTGGGIKTTTLAVLIYSIKSTLLGKESIVFGGRTLSKGTVIRAMALTFMSFAIVGLFAFFLIVFMPNWPLLTLIFEIVSAFGTVGLSLGVTPYLSPKAQILLSLLMLIGRIGPMTMIFAIGEKKIKQGKVDYPEGRIAIG